MQAKGEAVIVANRCGDLELKQNGNECRKVIWLLLWRHHKAFDFSVAILRLARSSKIRRKGASKR
jgi:hypothetical protein